MIETKIFKAAEAKMENLTVRDVRIGLGYTAVKNSAGGLGLAYTFRKCTPDRCSIVRDAGDFIGRNLSQTAEMFFDSNNLINSALGLAAINSTASIIPGETFEGDVLKAVSISKDDRVVMIGHFAPIEREIKKITPHLFILDDGLNRKANDNTVNIDEIMMDCSVALITATTLINKTLVNIVKKTENARIRVLLGPSTPLFKEAFCGEGIHVLSGMVPENIPKILEIVSQGGGTMHFKEYAQKVNLFVEN